MTDDWREIDDGWEDVDVDKKKRTRARGKKRRATAGEPAPRQQPRKRPKTHNHPPVTAEGRTGAQGSRRPAWLLPTVAFFVVLGIVALALVASR